MNFDDIAAFNAVVETGSISAAGRRLGLAKSVISKRVKDLEAAVSATLFKRSTRSVRLTDQGRLLYGHTRAILNQLDEAASAVAERADELRGTIRVAAPVSFGTLHLGRLLWPFLQRHPGIEMAIDLDDRVVDLLGNGYDLGIRVGRLPDSSLIARRLACMRTVACASPDYLQRRGVPKALEDLADHECIGYAHLTAGQVWQFEPARGSDEPRTVRVRGRFVANNGDLMRDAAIAGVGIALLPEFLVADPIRDGRLVAVCRPAVHWAARSTRSIPATASATCGSARWSTISRWRSASGRPGCCPTSRAGVRLFRARKHGIPARHPSQRHGKRPSLVPCAGWRPPCRFRSLYRSGVRMNRFIPAALAATLALSATAASAAPVAYTFDTVHSRVTFYVNHLGFSNSVGEFKLAPGTFNFDNDDWSKSSVSVKLPVSSLELGDTTWNGHIQGKDWLDLSQYPDIAFTSTKVEKTDATHGKLHGNLTVHGVTKPVTLDLTVNKVGEHFLRKTQAAGFTAKTTVKRSEFGVTAYAGAIGEDVDVRIEIESYVDKPAK